MRSEVVSDGNVSLVLKCGEHEARIDASTGSGLLPSGPVRHLSHEELAAVLLATHDEYVFYQACASVTEDGAFLELRFFNRSLCSVSFSVSGEVVALSPRDTVARQMPLPKNVEYGEVSVSGFEQVDVIESLPLSVRGAAYLKRAHEATRGGDYRSALADVDSALSTLGDDPLTWWNRAALARHLGEENDTELTTAHALSPLEPVLRAEAFLAVPQSMGSEPTTVLKPLVDEPQDLLEAIHVLTSSGFIADAARVIDDALRHREIPLLRYLYAWNLYKSTRMQVEAAGLVAQAGKAPLEPPFAGRSSEMEAAKGLAEAFPKDGRLAEFLKRSGPAT